MTERGTTTTAQRWVLGLASLGSAVVALDALVVATALTTVQERLGATLAELEWTVNAYNLPFAVLMVTAAAMGDRWGRRRVFTAGFALFTLASIACAFAPTAGWLIAGRAVQGIGAAAVLPLAIGMIGAAFPGARRGWATGVFTGLTGVAVLAGPVIGGAVTHGLSWQWIFWINVPIGVALVPLAMARLPESRGAARRLDLPGAVLTAATLLGVVWGVIRGPEIGWAAPEVLGAFAAAIVLGAALVVHERRTAEPMVPAALLRVRPFLTAGAAGFLLTAALLGTLFFVTQFVQVVLGSDPLRAGWQVLPWTATLFVVGPLAGRLVDRVGERPLVAGGLLLQAVGLVWLAAAAGSGYGALVAPIVLAGVGVSVAMTAAQSAAVAAAPPGTVGVASGLYAMARQLGGVVGIALAGAVFVGGGGGPTPAAFLPGFAAAITAAAALSLVGALVGLGLPARQPASAVPATAGAR
ncbi:MFS transporter [Pseudonocardia sp. CA-107938]|uniref:MFS transporter n=1 Tax=Pseudonocardia sp. CA-107938 TaxID=3240021 RepID=UPI003D8F026B